MHGAIEFDLKPSVTLQVVRRSPLDYGGSLSPMCHGYKTGLETPEHGGDGSLVSTMGGATSIETPVGQHLAREKDGGAWGP